MGAPSADRADLSNCNWVRASESNFSDAGDGDYHVASHLHCYSDPDRNAHPNRYPGSHARAGDRYAASHAYRHSGFN